MVGNQVPSWCACIATKIPAPDPEPVKVLSAGFQVMEKAVSSMVPEQVFALKALKYPVQVASTARPRIVPPMVVPSVVRLLVAVPLVKHGFSPVKKAFVLMFPF